MPTVPQYTPRVDTAPLQPGRITATPSPDAFGASIGRGVQQVGDQVVQIGAQERQRAISIQTQDAVNQAQRVKLELAAAAAQRRGKDAFGLPEQILPDYDKRIADIDGGLSTPEAREAFRQHAQGMRTELEDHTVRHMYQESRAYDGEVYKAAVESGMQGMVGAADDPALLERERLRLHAAISDFADRNGAPPIAKQAGIAQADSQAFSAIIGAQLDRGDDLTAARTYAAHKDKLLPTDRAKIERALEVGSLRGEGQRRSDAIMAQAETLDQALEQARAISDEPGPLSAKLRDEVTARVKASWADRRQAERDAEEQGVEQAANAIDAYAAEYGPANAEDVVPTSLWSTLKPSARSSLEAYAKRLQRNEAPPKLSDAYYQLRTLAGSADANPDDRSRWLRTNLTEYRGVIAEDELKELMGLQAADRGKKADSTQTAALRQGFQSVEDVANQTLASIGIDPRPYHSDGGKTTVNPQAIAFRRQLDRAIIAEQEATGKKLTPPQVQEIADKLVVEQTYRMRAADARAAGKIGRIDAWMYNADALVPVKGRLFESPAADKIAGTFSQVPAADRTRIAAEGKAKLGRDPTPDEIVAAWNYEVTQGAANAR